MSNVFKFEVGELLQKDLLRYSQSPERLLVLQHQPATSTLLEGYLCMLLPNGDTREYSRVHVEKVYIKAE